MNEPTVEIAVRNVRAYGKHGADPGERDHVQPLDVDVWLEAATGRALATDALADALDYAALHREVVRIVETTSFALLERLAAAILDALLADARVQRAAVTVAKPRRLAGATPSVTVRARRSEAP